jgi:hypothetical protein
LEKSATQKKENPIPSEPKSGELKLLKNKDPVKKPASQSNPVPSNSTSQSGNRLSDKIDKEEK